jgi:CheY-like chemotaxis protein
MPVMDGLDAVRKLAEMGNTTPVVVITANVMSTDKEMYGDYGMNDCLSKPFVVHDLWNCLLKYIKPTPRVAVAAQAAPRVEEYATRVEDDEDAKLKMRLITNFLKDNKTRADDIKKACESGDIKLAHRLAHTLKSNAGQLGKTLLQKAAAEIENQLRDGQNLVTPEQMDALESSLGAALAELEPQVVDLSASGAAPTTEIASVEASLELIEKLEPMLELGDIGARQFIFELRRIPGSEDLIQQIEDFDFDLALTTLSELKKSLETQQV